VSCASVRCLSPQRFSRLRQPNPCGAAVEVAEKGDYCGGNRQLPRISVNCLRLESVELEGFLALLSS
jgi:hypothetical protein